MRLVIKTYFDAAHRLPHYNGPCSRLHGHRWNVEVEVDGDVDVHSGMVMDFKELKAIVNKVMPDHQFINEYLPEADPPTAEVLVAYLYAKLATVLPGLRSLTLWESPEAGARIVSGQ